MEKIQLSSRMLWLVHDSPVYIMLRVRKMRIFTDFKLNNIPKIGHSEHPQNGGRILGGPHLKEWI